MIGSRQAEAAPRGQQHGGRRADRSMARPPVDALKAVRTGGLSIPGTIADRSHNFWLDRRAGSLGCDCIGRQVASVRHVQKIWTRSLNITS